MKPRVSLVYFRDCPNVDVARTALRQALTRCGLQPAWQEWDTLAGGVPPEITGYGSPTVLVDGKDVMRGAPGQGGACVVQVPTADAIAVALRAASW